MFHVLLLRMRRGGDKSRGCCLPRRTRDATEILQWWGRKFRGQPTSASSLAVRAHSKSNAEVHWGVTSSLALETQKVTCGSEKTALRNAGAFAGSEAATGIGKFWWVASAFIDSLQVIDMINKRSVFCS